MRHVSKIQLLLLLAPFTLASCDEVPGAAEARHLTAPASTAPASPNTAPADVGKAAQGRDQAARFGDGFEGDAYCCIRNVRTDACISWCGG